MNRTQLVISITLLCLTIISACSSNTKDVQTLNTKVDQLSNDINVIRSEIQSTKKDAVRANQRLDNQMHSYHK